MNDQLFVSTVFIAGLLSFFAPCILPLLPVYVGHLSVDIAGGQGKQIKFGKLSLHPVLIYRTFLFVLGLSTSFVLLGFGAGALGGVINSIWFVRVMGALVVLLGIHQMGLIHLKALDREKKINVEESKKHSTFGTYLLGFTFSFGWTPCIGPVLAAVLGVSASEGSAAYGGWLMFVYALGLMIPFMIMALFSDLLLSRIKGLYKHMKRIKIIGGLLIILMGLLLMFNQLNQITVFFERILQ